MVSFFMSMTKNDCYSSRTAKFLAGSDRGPVNNTDPELKPQKLIMLIYDQETGWSTLIMGWGDMLDWFAGPWMEPSVNSCA